MGRAYLIRYGLARTLGRFESATEAFDRGQSVVIRTHRGTEVGEVLAEAPSGPSPSSDPASILRLAASEDRERARSVESERADRFAACQAVLDGGTWPLEVIDAEPLLDQGRTVLHYLGPHNLNADVLIEAFRDQCGLDVVLEPVGRDVSEPEPELEPDTHGCGSCGSSGGGCGSTGGGCGSGSDGCAIKSLVKARQRVAFDA